MTDSFQVSVSITAILWLALLPTIGWAESYHFKNGGTLNINKEVFICDEAQSSQEDFECEVTYRGPGPTIEEIPIGPATGDASRYVSCTLENGCRVSPADFGVGIFKEVVSIPRQSAEGEKTNLNNFHYVVSEDEVDDVWDRNEECAASGFVDEQTLNKVQDNMNEVVEYEYCIDYSEDCAGTIRNREKKTCTISNYIWKGDISPRE